MKRHQFAITPVRCGILSALVLAASVSLISVISARADESSGSEGNKGQLSSTDYKFVTTAVQDNQAEIALGQLASKNASDPSVREFGTRMVQDHGKANQELLQLISQKGATVPDNSKEADRAVKRLQDYTGGEFDRTYIKRMVADHKDDIRAFQKQAQRGDDADIKTWVSKTLPVLQEHLQMAQQIETKLTASPTAFR